MGDIFGTAGNDNLLGTAGNDDFHGNGGEDVMTGLAGDDTYRVDSPGDRVVEDGAFGGRDLVISSISFTLPAYVEDLVLTGTAALSGIGNSLGNSITGNGGPNVLWGYGGNDVLFGGSGDDQINGGTGGDAEYGGTGDDLFNVDDAGDQVVEMAGEGTDRVVSTISWTLSDNVENLTLTGLANTSGLGNALANILQGNSGSNSLYGFGGNDTFDSFAGGDRLYGGEGDDTYFVRDATDQVIENPGEGTDLVFSTVSFVLGLTLENLYLQGSAAVDGTGNSLANSLTGNDAANTLLGGAGDDVLNARGGRDILNGGSGADSMRGAAGDDTYYVDNAGDRVVESSGAGRDRVYSSISYTLQDNVEILALLGTSAINGTGNALGNTLVGNSAANVLAGGGGADVVTGGLGGDTFVFRDGDFAGPTFSPDRIMDFDHAQGDRINLAGVDANTGATFTGDQAFAFIGTAAFHHTAGELRYEIVNGNTFVSGDTNGDGLADFMIRLDGSHALVSGDFVL